MTVSPIFQRAESNQMVAEIIGLLQNPSVVKSYALIAFATLNGVLLLGPEKGGPLFSFLERKGNLDWVVGIDAVTTADALRMLRNLGIGFSTQFNLRVFANRDRTLFHPKLYIFQNKDNSGTVLVGSNNLTKGGLVDNIELSARLDLEVEDLAKWIDIFDQVTAMPQAAHLLTDSLLERVAERQRHEFRTTRRIVIPKTDITREEPETTLVGARILLQMVPRSGDRLSQVGIAAKDMGDFFGLVPGEQRVISLQQVQPITLVGPMEERVLVRSNVNKNSRIEVAGIKGISYPSDDTRPILIFEEVGNSLFRYMLLLPGDDGYYEVHQYLEKLPKIGSALPHEIITVGKLLDIWLAYPS